jgi:ACS family hexuronate transporter-like MFS transporter
VNRGAVLALVTLAHAFSALAALAVAPLAPFVLDAFHLSRGQVGLLLPAVYLGGVLMALPAGWLTDRLGVRATLALGQTLTAGLVMAAAAAPTLSALLACLVVAGFGFSVTNPATGKAIVEWFAPHQRGVAMGIKQTGLTLGGIGAALVLPPIATWLGWREALAVAGGLCLLSAAVVAALYRRPARVSRDAASAWPRLAELGAFLRRPGVLVLFASGLALSVTQSSLLAYLALFARETFGISAVTAGQLLALAQAGGTASRLVWGYASDRYFGSRRRPGVVITALVGAGACALLALGAALPGPLIPLLALVAGAGVFGWVGLYFALVAELGGRRYAGLLTGMAVTFSWSGVLVGPPLFGLVLDATDGYAWPWLVLSATAVVVAVALARLSPLVRRDANAAGF